MKIYSLSDTEETTVSHNAAIRKKMLIQPDEINNLTYFSQAIFPPGEIAHAHCHHDMNEVFFIQSGHGVMTVNGNSFLLQAGTCIAINAGEVHELKNEGDEELIVTYFGISNHS